MLLRRIDALIVIEHGTHRAHLAASPPAPAARGRLRQRNFLMDLGERSASIKFLIRDRAGQFTDSFDAVFTADGIRIPASPPQAPRANGVCEQMIGTLRRELPGRLLIVSEHHLRSVPTGTYSITTLPGRTVPSASSPLPRLIPSRPNRSTSLTTGSTGSRSSADSPTNTTSLPDFPQITTPNRVSDPHMIPDLVNRDFTAEVPGRKMVGDISHIPTWEGWLYLATAVTPVHRTWPTGQFARRLTSRNIGISALGDRGARGSPTRAAAELASAQSA